MKRAAMLLAFIAFVFTLGAGSVSEPSESDRFIARELARLALIDLRQQAEPGPNDYALAAAILGYARELTPDDADLVRRQIESERAAGDERAVMLLTRDLVRLDPSDSIAQLRLLSWNASQKQTVGDRLAVYDLYLGPKGQEAIKDPAVRSRLALDAALLHREEGNEAEFIRLLTLATSLDSSNKEAASLALAFYQERRNDPVAILELAINLLMSDPIDPNLHFGVAAELAKHGVFDEAQRFHDNARRLIASDGVMQDPGIESEATILRWQTNDPGTVIAEFERMLLLQREAAKQRIAQLEKAGQPTQDIDKPEDIRLPIYSERLRVLAAAAAGDRVVVERSLRDLTASVVPELEEISSRLRTPAVAEDPQLRDMLLSRAASIASELVVARLVAGEGSQLGLDDVEALRQLFSTAGQAQLDVIDGLVTLRKGNVDEAVEIFTRLSEISTLGSVGLGLALEANGDPAGAAEAYKKTALFAPITPMGAFTRSRYEKLTGQKLVYSEHTEAMSRVAKDVPRWLDVMTADANRFMSLTTTLESTMIDAYEAPVIVLNIRNTAPLALAMGSDRPINSRMMISPSMDIASFPIDSALSPEIADLQRKLRLIPGESLNVRIWPDPGFAGWLAEIKSAHRVRNRWNVIQGFQIGTQQLYRPGPMCLSSETKQLTRRPDAGVRAPVADMIRELELYEDERLIGILPTLRAMLTDPDRPGGAPTSAEVTRIAGILSARYPTLSRTAKLAMITIVPHAVLCPGMEQFDERLLAETDPGLLAVTLFTRVKSGANQALARALASDDEKLSGVAQAIRNRFEAETVTGFAMTKPPGSHKPKAPEHPDSIELE